MAERPSAVLTAPPEPPGVHASGRVPEDRSIRVRDSQRPCRMCGRPIPPPDPGTPGQRARYCLTCKQVREALRYARAAVRRLEAIVPPHLREVRP